MKTVTVNRKVYHDYQILETLEAGIALTGTEIKSIRAGRVNLAHAYAKPENGEVWLLNAHIAPYEAGSYYNHDPKRPRKLLLHKDEINSLIGTVTQRGLTLVPLRLYIKNGIAKLELGVARGKKLHDKRRSLIQREVEREIKRALKHKKAL